jgi:hypothetical protein
VMRTPYAESGTGRCPGIAPLKLLPELLSIDTSTRISRVPNCLGKFLAPSVANSGVIGRGAKRVCAGLPCRPERGGTSRSPEEAQLSAARGCLELAVCSRKLVFRVFVNGRLLDPGRFYW